VPHYCHAPRLERFGKDRVKEGVSDEEKSFNNTDTWRLVEAHVTVTEERLGLFRQKLVVPAVVKVRDALIRQPVGQLRNVRHFWNVVAVLLT